MAMFFQRQEDPRITGLMPIGEKEVQKALATLTDYKQKKARLESRIVEDEEWWKLRHWRMIKGSQRGKGFTGPEPSSAYLFNAIVNKHADAMDNFPEPVVLPREQSDEESAKTLSSVLPVILETNGYEQVYSDNWWEKLKHGTAVYGVFWDNDKENGLGDVDIRKIDLLKIFWEPGITDIQKSRNLFIVELADEDLLDQQYPEHAGKMKGKAIDIKEYLHDDAIDTSGKTLVVDWYYKVRAESGKTLVHYVKFVGDEILYASENEPEYQDRGFYDHGLYPVVFDTLFPEEGTPVGFGYVAICKDPQMYIDKLSANILENAMMNTKKRFFISANTDINEAEFLDWNKPFVHTGGEVDDKHVREIVCQPLDSIYVSVVQTKIEEMKDTASNRDVNSGGYGSGVTAASAIAALQEAGNKTSRDMIAASYRAHVKINEFLIELIRQFYDEARAFRVTAPNGSGYEFVQLSNRELNSIPVGYDEAGQPLLGMDGQELFRKPVFDLKIKAQKKNPWSRMEQNEIAQTLYQLGFFNPDQAQAALIAIDMMDFEGIEAVREKISEGQTLMNIAMQLKQENDILKAAMGIPVEAAGIDAGAAGAPQAEAAGLGDTMAAQYASGIMNAQKPMTGYGQRLAERSTPDMARRD